MLDEHQGYNQAATCFVIKAGPQPLPPQVMLATLRKLRAFARLLCLDTNLADKLVTLTLLRASAGLKPSSIGPNLSIWLFSRLRSYYYREFCNGVYEPRVSATGASNNREREHDEVLNALARLPVKEREAVVLVDAAGWSLGEAARICHCAKAQFELFLATARAHLSCLLRGQQSEHVDPGKQAFRSCGWNQ